MERDEFTSKHSFLEGYTVESVEMVDGKENKNGQQCVILKKGDSQYKMMVTLKRGKKEDRAVVNYLCMMRWVFWLNVDI